MDQEIFVYVDPNNTPHRVGRLWLHVPKRIESATFRCDELWFLKLRWADPSESSTSPFRDDAETGPSPFDSMRRGTELARLPLPFLATVYRVPIPVMPSERPVHIAASSVASE